MNLAFSSAKAAWWTGRRCRSVGLWLAIAGFLWWAPPVHGQPDQPLDGPAQRSEAAELAERYIEDFIFRERLNAETAFLSRELERLELIGQAGSPGRSLLDELQWINPATRQALIEVLQAGARPLLADLETMATELRTRVEEFPGAWQPVRTALNKQRILLRTAKGEHREAEHLASLLSADKRWFWLSGVLAIAGLLGVVFHDRRHKVRRMLNGSRLRVMKKLLAAVVLILIVAILAALVMGERIFGLLLTAGPEEEIPPRQAIAARNAELRVDLEKLQQARGKLGRQHAEAEAAWRETLTGSLPPGVSLAGQWTEFRRHILEIAVQSALLESLSRAVGADIEQLEKLNRKLGIHTEATATWLRLRRWIRGCLGSALVGLAAIGGFLFWRGVRRRRQTTANTCPLCLGVNKLGRVLRDGDQDGDQDSDQAEDRPSRPYEMLRCKNVISRQPYEECDYTFMVAYRAMEKLCFPTLGIPQAGKTHWLAMLYWELNRGHFPETVRFEKIKSRSSEDFDVIVEEILNSRLGTAATQRERIPHPLVFNFQDHDRLSRSNVLVNIFDYSGEVTSDMGVEDYRRQRALEGDGFFFFLDPTFPAEPQAKALADFREDLRLIKGIKAGKPARIPMALCVSKIDLLAGQSYALPAVTDDVCGDAVADFYRKLGQIDPTGEGMTPKIIAARSRATARLRETIWPGWQVERQVDDLFGGRQMFFPLTPVGLDGRGETDLSLRTISPFGLLEPLVWLLQMNGYRIIE